MTHKIAVFGGASGLGQGVATLASEHYTVGVFDKQSGPGPNHFVCDVTDYESVYQSLAKFAEGEAHLKMVVNCAGIAPAHKVLSKKGAHPPELFAKTLAVNLQGSFNVLLAASAIMQKQAPDTLGARGVIVLTASVAAFEGQIGQVAYSASKGGVVGMTLPAARELAEHGIRVVTIAPGLMDTPLLQGLDASVREKLPEHIAFPKRLGHAEEFGALAMHILSNPYLNGEVIRLDGGLRMTAR